LLEKVPTTEMAPAILLSCLFCIPAPPVVAPLQPPFASASPAFAAPLRACMAYPVSPADSQEPFHSGSGGIPTTGPNGSADPLPGPAPVLPVAPARPASETTGVEWSRIGSSSLRMLAIMHVFRWATEPGTRAGGVSLGGGYVRSAANLHG